MIPELERSPGEGNGKPLQYSCLEKSIDGGAWWAAVHGVTKSQTQLSNFTFTCFLESHCSFIKGGFVPPLLHYFQESQPFWDHEPFGKSGEHYGPSLRIMFYMYKTHGILKNPILLKRKKESEVVQSCPTLCDSMDCSPPGSSIHGIF